MSSSTPFELYNPWGVSSVVGSTVTYNGHQVYGGPFYATATLISQDFASQSLGLGAEAGATDLGSAEPHSLAAVNAILVERSANDAGSSFPISYQSGQNHFSGIPAGGLSGESLLGSTMVAKDAGITDYLYGKADPAWSLANSVDPWGGDWLMEAKTSI